MKLMWRCQQCLGRHSWFLKRNVISISSSSTQDERYIQTSRVPTMHFQAGLFRLTIPKLEDTCVRYLSALQPVVQSESAFAATQKLVEEFQQGVGKELQVELVLKDKKNKHTSYISQPWFDMYLADRKSLVLNYNPFIAFKNDGTTTNQAVRAANLIWSAVRFKNALKEEQLKPEVFHLNPSKSDTSLYWNTMRWLPSSLSCYGSVLWKAFPLDMSQYSRLFNTTRIPVLGGVDELVTHDDTNSRHVLVMHNGHMYTLEALQHDGTPVSCQTLCDQLQGILEAKALSPSNQIGYLTALNRDKWAELRQEMKEQNQEALLAIDSALLVLCLDDCEHTAADTLSHAMLHNFGANRWFDKSIQLIVTQGGQAAINFEHAWGDGVAVLRFLEELYKDKKCDVPSINPTLEGVNKVSFNLSPRISDAVASAKEEVEARCQSLSVDTLEYQKYGKNFIKSKKLSPDGLLQLAIQIAYHRQYKSCVPTYESCSTAAFKHGRTETIRSATSATKQCAEAFEHSHSAGPEEMMELVKKANEYHSKLVKEAALGRGFDRHLFALKALAESKGLEVPLFQDPCYAYMNEIILSTSTLSSDAVLLGGFAPVSPDGYGVGYGIMEDWLGTQITTYPSRDGTQLKSHIQQVFDDIFDVLNRTNFKQ